MAKMGSAVEDLASVPGVSAVDPATKGFIFQQTMYRIKVWRACCRRAFSLHELARRINPLPVCAGPQALCGILHEGPGHEVGVMTLSLRVTKMLTTCKRHATVLC